MVLTIPVQVEQVNTQFRVNPVEVEVAGIVVELF